MIDENLLEKLSKHKDVDVKELVNWALLIIKSPYYDGYLADLTQTMFIDREMQVSPISIKSTSEEDTRLFDKVLKYMTERPKIYASLESTRQKLLPQQANQAHQDATSTIDEVRAEITKEFRNVQGG